MQGVRRSLQSGDPADFLVDACAIIAAGDAARQTLPDDWVGILEAFAEIDIAETTALLHVAAALSQDELHGRRLQRTLAQRRQPMPGYVTGLGEARVSTAYFIGHELGDGDNILLGVDFPDGTAMSAVVYIDHNMGTIVKDAFFIGEGIEHIRERYLEIMREEGDLRTTIPALDTGRARTLIEEALENLDELHPDWEQDQWPLCRPLVELLLRTMPEDDTADWPEERRIIDASDAEIAFWQAPESLHLGRTPDRDPAVMDAVGELFEFAEEHSGDPLRWSSVVIEVCVRSLAFDVTVSESALDAVPVALPAVVRFAHRERGISPESTAATLESIPGWLAVLAEVRKTGLASTLRSSNSLYAAAQGHDLRAYMRQRLLEILGSEAAVAALDDAPIPDEELDLSRVPADLHERVRAVSDHVDRLCEEGLPGLDAEFRSVCRRFLLGVAERNPEVLRRRSKDLNTASAIAWLLARENDLLGMPPRAVTAKRLGEFFGVPAGSDRAYTLRAAYTNDDRYAAFTPLGTELLVSGFRRWLVEKRDTYW